MQRMIVHELHRQQHVSNNDAQRRRLDPEQHFHAQRRATRMDSAAHSACPAGNKNCIARIAAHHDDLVTAEQRRHRVSRDNLSLFEIRDRVECEGSSDTGDGIEVHALYMSVARQ